MHRKSDTEAILLNHFLHNVIFSVCGNVLYEKVGINNGRHNSSFPGTMTVRILKNYFLSQSQKFNLKTTCVSGNLFDSSVVELF